MNSLLEEIEEWKLEAKLENSDRYFYHTRIVNRILSGNKLYVVGRKGTGKTAISEHLDNKREPGYHSQKLTFKNFPFNNLYELQDKGFTKPNQYITLWKYLIYSTICKLMSKNPSVGLETRERLKYIFNDDIENALPNAIDRWTSLKFDIKVLGTGIGFGTDKKTEDKGGSDNWIERVDILEHFLKGQIGADKYLIMFDELDEDYKDIIEPEKYKQYTDLLTSLFKAVQDIRARFSDRKLYPVVFIRDDIYEILQDPDKTKWLDYKADLEWDEDSIKNMLAFRLSRAVSKTGEIQEFTKIWQSLFTQGNVRYGDRKRKSMTPFDYITRSSFLRPRDYIRYLQVCAEMTLEKGFNYIEPATLSEADTAFSNYLRSELEDEIHGAIPDIHKILDIFTTLRKQTLRIEEFIVSFNQASESGLIKTNDSQFVLQMLFHFSIIGNQPKQVSYQVFRYKNKEARLNMSENIILHRGLFRALQIL